jgi:hypothetical protein
MNEAKKGSCMCAGVQFEYTGTPFSFSLCHCQMCQKFSGGAFGAFVGLKKNDFKYSKGEELVTEFKSSDWASRTFCSKCGSSLMYLYHEMTDSYFVSAGSLDDDPEIRPDKHIFVKDKCQWFNIIDDIPQIESY